MSSELRLAILQVPAGAGEQAALAAAAGLARLEPGLVLLPENWLSSHPVSLEDYAGAVERLAEEASAPVAAGAQYVIDSGRRVSMGLLAVPGSGVYTACEKVYPSKAVGERGFIERGRLYKPLSVSGWMVSCIVCVDVFYPELSRAHVLAGAELLLNPAKITVDRVPLWRAALLARAAENVAYTAGSIPAKGSYRDGRTVEGGGAVYTPDGKPLLEVGGSQGPHLAGLERARLEAASARWAFRDDMKELRGMYTQLLSAMLEPRRV